MAYQGRKEIFTDEIEITKKNIGEVLKEAFKIHNSNRAEIDYLQKYEKGVQPVLNRIKEVRPEINHKVVENHASEITSFKVGYVFGSPVTYVQRASVDSKGEIGETDDKRIAVLNEMMFENGKASQDQELSKDFMVCGVGYRMALPKKVKTGVADFDIIRLNPKNTFVVRFNDVYKKVAIGVSYVVLSDNKTIRAGAYTDNEYFELEGTGDSFKVVKTERNIIGMVPIVEYVCDDERMCCFERV